MIVIARDAETRRGTERHRQARREEAQRAPIGTDRHGEA